MLAGLISILLPLFLSLSMMEWLSITLFSFNVILFLSALGTRIDVISIILLFASSQWLLGPVIAYHGYSPYFRYNMYVDTEVYFSFVLPAFIFFEIAMLFLWNSCNKQNHTIFNKMLQAISQRPNLIYILIGIGAVAMLGRTIAPGSLRFVFFLLSGCLYIGGILYFLNDMTRKWFLIGGLSALLLFESIGSGLFHNMILWFLFIYMYISYYLKTSFRINILVISAALFGLLIIQSIKGTYRTMMMETGVKEGKTQVFLTLAEEQAGKAGELTAADRVAELNVRLNQGWIISRIMMNIPTYNDYLEGYTFSEALDAALVPRFLSPSKRLGGSVFTFELLTGLNIDESTSMGPSLMGEAYGNYGAEKGIWAMFIIGLIMGGSVFLVMRLSTFYPILFAFIPIIFFQVVKAETDSITVLNHLVKSLVLFIPLSIFLTNRFLK